MRKIRSLGILFCIVLLMANVGTGCGKEPEAMPVEESVLVETVEEESETVSTEEPVPVEAEREDESLSETEEVEEEVVKEFVLSTQVDIGLDTEEGQAFESFLEGSAPAIVSEDLYQGPWDSHLDMEVGKELYLQDIIDIMGYEELEELRYGLIDCGRDGEHELSVQIKSSDSWDGFYQLVFCYQEEKLVLACMTQSLQRGGTDIDNIGYVYNYASGGANAYFMEFGILNAEGKYEAIYEVDMTSGFPKYEPGLTFWSDGNEEVPIEFDETIIEGQTYYSYYIYAADYASDYTEEELEALQKKCEEYIELCKIENNIYFSTEEELNKAIVERMKKIGADHIYNFYEEEYPIEWNSMMVEVN